MEEDNKANALIWFRGDLRVLDNSSVTAACKDNRAIAVYCFDPRHYDVSPYGFKKTEKFRAQFLIETVTALRNELAQLNITLLVHVDRPEHVIPELVKAHGIQRIYAQEEWTREEKEVTEAVKATLGGGISFKTHYDQFLFHPEDLPFSGFEALPKVFTAFRKKCEKYSRVRAEATVPQPMPKDNRLPNTPIPRLEDLGLEAFETDPRTAFPFHGGAAAARARMDHYFWETKKLAHYKKTRNGLLGTDYSSKLSPWLANGSLSPKTVYWEVKRFEREETKNQDTYWLIFELIWRDFFKYVSLKHGNAIFLQGGILQKDYEWHFSKNKMEQWINGSTPEAFVNANMRELAATGWISNRGRQNVASFWAKEWQQDWRYGAAYFESVLLDYDVHSNWGNWMYNSGVGNDPRDRKFNIARQAGMYDPQGKYQRLWLQETLF
ncbi:DASH family cryptochrome [Maribacter sp. 2307ULW6-5]|uniref:DASH family cryptochrome n=1 Tax=Maribacter sp. 2307ULW6-5 TaxID=3386275 RepID=UPI0039BD5780